MNPPHTFPSRPLRWTAALLRVLLWAVVGAWLVFGLTLGAIHGFIVPRIAEWRPALETLATRAIGVPVRIGEVSAHSPGWIPSLELKRVSLLDRQGREALVLGRVLTAVSVTSLWRLGFEQIHIDSPTLDVRRLASGGWEIAGIPIPQQQEQTSDTNQALDWFFSQKEFAIQSGTVRWTDDLTGQPPLTLNGVNLVVRNSGRQHLMRLDATPDDGLSGRVALRADMRSPFLSMHPGRLSDWRGTAYLHWPGAQLARLAQSAQLQRWFKLRVAQGQGALRVWADLDSGEVKHLTADLALDGVQAQFASAPQPLALAAFSGRITATRTATGWDLGTGPVAFATPDGQRWQHGRLRLQASLPEGDQPRPGSLEASGIHLGALHALGAGLPLPPALHFWLAELQPQGHIDTLKLAWTANATGWATHQASGTVSGLALAPQAMPPHPPAQRADPVASSHPGRPGFSGATVAFDLDHNGGQAQLTLAKGQLIFPGVFDEPTLPMDTLSAEVVWRVQGSDLQVQVNRARFANADLQGQASATWRTSDPAHADSGTRFPGILQLDGVLSQGKAERVHRYLPRVIAAEARAYVKAAVVGGQARDVRFKVAGDLFHMPFENPQHGEFHVAAQVSGVELAFVPTALQPSGQPPWPTLRQVEGELVFDRASMSVAVRKGSVAGVPGLKLGPTRARIASLSTNAVVEVSAQVDGPVTDLLGVVNRSPLALMTSHALAHTTATGNGSVQFNLAVPLARVEATTVKGQVTLAGNDIQINPSTPLLARTRGRVDFDERGFQVAQASTRLAGGELQWSGGTASPGGTLLFKGQGQATAEGLRQLPALSAWAPLMRHGSGAAAYTAQLALGDAGPDLVIQSSTQGLALALPAPLTKVADAVWPLSYRLQSPTAHTERHTLRWDTPTAPVLALSLRRALAVPGVPGAAPSASEPLQGLVQLGAGAVRAQAPPPSRGLSLHLGAPEWDADAWEAVLTAATPGKTPPATDTVALPDAVRLTTERLTQGGRPFHAVTLDVARQGNRWSGRVQARELAGQIELTTANTTTANTTTANTTAPTTDTHLKARLERLSLSSAAEPPIAAVAAVVGGAADAAPPTAPPAAPAPASEALRQLPSLDVQVQALDIDGKALGQLELQAVNRPSGAAPREWRLTRLRLSVPEAELTATGNWVPVGAMASTTAAPVRRTVLRFKLDVKDAGALLTRLGMPQVFQDGNGQLEGTLGWLGAPHALHTPSLSGQLKLAVSDGRFLKADPGLAKLLGVLSLQSLPRRLALDFRDVFAQGFAFDFVRGDARVEQGIAFTNNLQMKGPTAAVLLEGQADIGRETQDIRAVVVPELNAGTASLIATVINPAVGLGSFLAQTLLRQPLMKASTREFRVQGTWADPVVTRTDTPLLGFGNRADPASPPLPLQPAPTPN